MTCWRAGINFSLQQAAEEILPCCGSKTWAHRMAMRRPLGDEEALLAGFDDLCEGLTESDWLEAFRSHPRIGESRPEGRGTARSAAWSGQEQRTSAARQRSVKSCTGGSKSRVRAAVPAYLYRVRHRQIGRGNSGDLRRRLRTTQRRNFAKQPSNSGRSRRFG